MTGDKQVSFPVATVGCPESFTLGPAHQMRSAPCLACREPVGGEPVTVIGVAALAGPACECGGVVSDVFLVHASHLPLPQLKLQAMIQHALGCALPH